MTEAISLNRQARVSNPDTPHSTVNGKRHLRTRSAAVWPWLSPPTAVGVVIVSVVLLGSAAYAATAYLLKK